MQAHKEEGYGKFDFIKYAPHFGLFSLALVIISLVYLGINGINYGIDFAGGTEIQVRFDKPVTINQLREVVDAQKVKNAEIQAFTTGSEFTIRFQVEEGKTEKETNDRQNAAVNAIREGISTKFAAESPDFRRVDSVGPQVGADLKRSGLLSIFYSLLVILIYIGLRFDYHYAPGAVLCLAHDAIVTLAIFVAVGKEVNVAIMAAILTLIGYSLNDTIVVFDRIREIQHDFKDKGLSFIINRATNEMLSRTLITSGTTFVCGLCLYFIAGGTVSDIAFALCVGIVMGTYSSIYVAAPFMILLEKFEKREGKATARPARA